MIYPSQYILFLLTSADILFPFSILWPFAFIYLLVKSIRNAMHDKPYALVGFLTGVVLMIMLAPLVLYGLYNPDSKSILE